VLHNIIALGDTQVRQEKNRRCDTYKYVYDTPQLSTIYPKSAIHFFVAVEITTARVPPKTRALPIQPNIPGKVPKEPSVKVHVELLEEQQEE
jgi:hypothetical protein